MGVAGLGTDIIRVDRIAAIVERHGDRFLRRVYRPDELAVLTRVGAAAYAALAARWAAKEAFLKALGPRSANVPYRDVEVVRGAAGEPWLRLHGAAARALADLGATRALVSLSHEGDHAVATVILV
ncbi:MAG TPA: holo-ACP synthase [Candidatus Krumholzibacteria bacterium]|nr:holo-ACP synthase [Candidatus Krumholzibacteria bacterium]HPD71727.1 holo-ACP synthase [Candidatus Krumholzibacteria bacterium]HRY41340.1 holo-ACP synthase [Candidatus Krumholzibacteria bacterium]